MKEKLNLTINSTLITRSKLYAKKHSKSVSQLVEELLAKKVDEDKTSFTSKWMGKLALENKESERAKFLKKRYQL